LVHNSPRSSAPANDVADSISDMTTRIVSGYQPGCLGRIVQMHGTYYAQAHRFGLPFEAKVARELAEFAQRLDHPLNRLWLALDDAGDCVGSLAIDAQDLGPSIAHLRWFILGDNSRGKGVGRDLLEQAVLHCDQAGLSTIQLWTFRGLDAARHLYESAGFVLAEEHSGAQWGTLVSEQRFERRRSVG